MKSPLMYLGLAVLAAALQSCGGLSTTSSAPAPPRSPLIIASDTTGKIHLKYSIETYTSQALGYQHTYGLVLPPDYAQATDRHYPVIFLLHGGHGGPTDMFQKGKARLLPTLTHLYESGKLPPSIIITPDGYDERGTDPHRDPAYVDGPHGKIDTAIGDELVKLVQTKYRTLPAPDFWAIGGLSSGAWGALNIGMHHPDHFSVLVSQSGYFTDPSGPNNSPTIYVSQLSPDARKNLHIYLDVGEEDKRFLNDNQAFHDQLNQLGIDNAFNHYPGMHTWTFWREHFVDSLTYVGQQFQQAAAKSANAPMRPTEAARS